MVSCYDVLQKLESLAPSSLAESWDNVGLIIGDKKCFVKNILLSLDLSDDVIYEAIEKGANLIITHHPIMLSPVKNILNDDFLGRKILSLIKNDINLICFHTNLDSANGGVNDALANSLGLLNVEPLYMTNEKSGLAARCGTINKLKYKDFIENVKKALNISSVKFVGNCDDFVSKIAVCGGSGADFINACIDNNIDVLVTADVKYHTAQLCFENNIKIIDAGHFETEVVVLKPLFDYLKSEFGDNILPVISKKHTKSFWNYI